MLCLLVVTVLGCSIGARSLPVPYSGPHLANDWGQPVRHRHLYATRRGLHLQINTDGKITGSHAQSLHSLVEIWPVETGCVAIKGVASSRFLCMERNGKLYGSRPLAMAGYVCIAKTSSERTSNDNLGPCMWFANSYQGNTGRAGKHIYTQEDCSFIERILPDGYSIYISGKHGALVNLGGGKNNKDGTTLSQFLPMVNTLSQEPTNNHQSGEQHSLTDPEHDLQLGLQIDSMDPFGKISQIVIQSPSFNKR